MQQQSATVLHGRFTEIAGKTLPAALTPARDNLRQAITRLAQAQREVEAAAAPPARLREVLAQYDAQQAKLAECHARDRVRLAELMAEGSSLRSYTSDETVEANAAAIDLAEARQAALEALPGAEQRHRQAIERVTAAMAERSVAIRAVLEEELGVLLSRMAPAALVVREMDEQVASLFTHLAHEASTGNLLAAQARERAATLVKAARQAIPRPPPSDWCSRMIAGLTVDPAFGMGLAP